jgi:hypothetical protein
MADMLTGSGLMDAERAFVRQTRARRRAALARRLRGEAGGRLPVYDPGAARTGSAQLPGGGIREIRLDAIAGTLEPARAALFDGAFRPRRAARQRWERVWLAEHRGRVLPPISVARVGDRYAVRDGHHRVSVARARGATTIDATVEAAAA